MPTDYQAEESDSCSILAARIGLKYKPQQVGNDVNYGARTAIQSLSDKVAEQCGEHLYGKRNSGEPFRPLAEKNLMTDPLDMWRLFIYAERYFSRYKHFLDLGCGSGFPVCLGLRLGYDSCGVDNDSDVVPVARQSLEKIGENPKRIVFGDFLTDDFWKTPILGRLPTGFDFYYLYDQWANVENALPQIAQRIGKDRYIVLRFWDRVATFGRKETLLEECNLVWEEDPPMFVFLRKKS